MLFYGQGEVCGTEERDTAEVPLSSPRILSFRAMLLQSVPTISTIRLILRFDFTSLRVKGCRNRHQAMTKNDSSLTQQVTLVPVILCETAMEFLIK